jgi:hypothetical protein
MTPVGCAMGLSLPTIRSIMKLSEANDALANTEETVR